MTEHKTDFFGSFLDAMKATPPMTRVPSTAGSDAQPGIADAVLLAVFKREGHAEIKELLPLTGYSVDRLMAALSTLVSFGLARHESGNVDLTDEGMAAAHARSAA